MDGYRLSPLDVAAGVVLGPSPDVSSLPSPDDPASMRSAFDDEILAALGRPPCVVSFSGGRDSSAVLAVAARLAREHGLPLPVPVTNRFPGPDAAEAGWQEQVIAHLDLDDWVVHNLTDEVDLVGPLAQQLLRRHGLMFPFNVHFLLLAVEAAAGGSLLTGIGGDELMSARRLNRAAALLVRHARPNLRDMRTLAILTLPGALRGRLLTRGGMPIPWLRPIAHREFRRQLSRWVGSQPLWHGAFIRDWLWPARYQHLGQASLATVAQPYDVQVHHPFTDPAVLAEVAAAQPRVGFTSRTDAMRCYFSDVLPEAVLARESKAAFFSPFFGRHTREFIAERWQGEGVDATLVDPDRLRDVWSQRQPDGRSYLLLQAAWLATSTGRDVSSS